MSTNNPFRKHANPMFASRGCDMDLAMAYATEVLFALSSDKAAAMTALMVVVNTAANAFDQATGPSPEKLAIIELIDSRINEHLLREGDIHQSISDWFDNNVDIDDRISSWMSDNFDVTDYNVDAIDIDEKVTDWMNEYLESHIGQAINNMDLVVRTR
jgi:hypothetical protein